VVFGVVVLLVNHTIFDAAGHIAVLIVDVGVRACGARDGGRGVGLGAIISVSGGEPALSRRARVGVGYARVGR
jgi:hypothetical protein